jgi:vancomycin permeability regulator SanA
VGKEGFDEAVVMKKHLVASGIPGERVIVDSEGVTTFASAKNTMKIAREHGFRSVFVVSQYFHVPRSCMVLRRMGMTTLHSAHARIFELRDLYSIPRELIGYIRYRFRDDSEATGRDGS